MLGDSYHLAIEHQLTFILKYIKWECQETAPDLNLMLSHMMDADAVTLWLMPHSLSYHHDCQTVSSICPPSQLKECESDIDFAIYGQCS